MIKTPAGWGIDRLTQSYQSSVRNAAGASGRVLTPQIVRRIDLRDLRWALARGWDDFAASRTDVIFLCVVYPVVGLLLARLVFGYQMLPLIFPLASGFALLGPLAAVGLNEMSRRREQGLSAGLLDAFSVFRSPSIGSILLLGIVLMMMFVFWLTLSQMIYSLTLGPQPPASLGAFAYSILHTGAGWIMAVVGIGAGFLFAVIALAISAISFPMLLDRPVSLETAVRTSVRVVQRNPLTMAIWGIIITAGLVLGSLPALLGLVVVMPVLGHATWHLYRRVVQA